VWTATGAVLGVQLVGLILYSAYLYHRFDVSEDFAHNAQAWFLIGSGHLDPVDTVRVPTTLFLRDHFDLVLWPLSLLRLLSSSAVTLLFVQDLAIVAAEAVTMMWVVRVCDEYLERWRLGAELIALGVLVANAWWYETASFDIHLPPLGLPLAVLTGYLLWCGRSRRALIPAACCLLFGAVVVELVAFVGIGALLTRRVRDGGGTVVAAVITVVSLAWLFIVTGSGFNQASNIASQYSYLIGPGASGGALSILRGIVRHPGTAIHTVAGRWHAIGRPLAMAGLLGLLTPGGALVAIGVLVPAALASSTAYSSSAAAFQTVALVPFVLVGTVMVLARGATRAWGAGGRLRDRRVVVGLATVVIALALFQDTRLLANLRAAWWRVTPPASAALAAVLAHTPPRAEVIASNGIVGRFSERRYVYILAFAPQTFPVKTDDVVFVITPSQGNEAMLPPFTRIDATYVTTALHARTLLDRDGVVAVQWRPPPGTRSVTLTSAAGTSHTTSRPSSHDGTGTITP
jgi:hypothetical protein